MKTKITYALLVCFIVFNLASYAQNEVKVNTNFVVESDGTFRMDGAATVWDDIMVFPDATSKGSSYPPTMALFKNNSSQGVFLYWFSATAENELYFTIQIPHSYKVGTTLYPHVHWTTSNGTPNNSNARVVWALEYSVVAIGGTFPNTTTVTGNTVISAITPITGVGQHLITSLGTIPGTGLGISTILVCRIYRKATDGTDDFTNTAGLLGFDIHFEKDTEGSRTEFEK